MAAMGWRAWPSGLVMDLRALAAEERRRPGTVAAVIRGMREQLPIVAQRLREDGGV